MPDVPFKTAGGTQQFGSGGQPGIDLFHTIFIERYHAVLPGNRFDFIAGSLPVNRLANRVVDQQQFKNTAPTAETTAAAIATTPTADSLPGTTAAPTDEPDQPLGKHPAERSGKDAPSLGGWFRLLSA